jgi:hypothetical protein
LTRTRRYSRSPRLGRTRRPFWTSGLLAGPARPAIPTGVRPDNNRPFGGHIWNRNAYYSLPNERRDFVKRRVFSARKKRAQLNMDSKINFDFAAQLPPTNRARGRFGFWVLASIAVVAGLVAGEVYPMHAFGPSKPNATSIKLLKIQRDFEARPTSPSVPQKNNAEPGKAKPSSVVQKPEGSAQPTTAVADAFVPLPRARPKLQIVRYSRYYYVRTVDQGDTDGRLTFHIERRLCKSPNLPPICFEPLSVRHETILDDF